MNEVSSMRPFLDNWIWRLKHNLRDLLKISLALSMEKNSKYSHKNLTIFSVADFDDTITS